VKRRIHRSGVVLVSAALAIFMIAPASSFASTPAGWAMTARPTPSTVIQGASAGYKVTITNSGPSNIATLYLGATLTGSSNPAVFPPTTFVGTPSQGTCKPKAGPLSCAFGTLKAYGTPVTVTVAFATPTSGSSFGITFLASTTGATTSDGGTSHGDNLPASVSTSLVAAGGDVAGGFAINGSSFTTGGGGGQGTTVTPPGTGIGILITETGDTTNVCGTGTPIGQSVALSVADGVPVPLFKTTLTIATSTLGHNEALLTQFTLCHKYDNGTSANLQLCPVDPAITAPVAKCFWRAWGGPYHWDGSPAPGDADDWTNLVLTMYDTQNGTLRGTYG